MLLDLPRQVLLPRLCQGGFLLQIGGEWPEFYRWMGFAC